MAQNGLKRTLKYWLHRISRIPDSTYAISAGIAFGASISFTPFVGLHFILAGLLAWVFRANIIASAIGTIVGNPWTFPRNMALDISTWRMDGFRYTRIKNNHFNFLIYLAIF